MNSQIIQEAAEWLVEFNTDTTDFATRKRFDAWLRKSPEHVRAFLELLPIWEDGALLSHETDDGAERLIERARAASSVVHMESPAAQRRFGTGYDLGISPARRIAHAWLPVSLAAIAIAAILVWVYQTEHYPTYATGVGEQRSLVLPDNSTLELDSMSRVRVHFSKQIRSVQLLQGQALFRVAKNPARPFIVSSGQASVRAVGTLFDVYRRPVNTLVTVEEGRVAVYEGSRTAEGPNSSAPVAISDDTTPHSTGEQSEQGTVFLDAGEQLMVSPNAMHKLAQPDVMGAVAWMQRQLVFDSTPLSEVAEEFNRYSARRLIIDVPQLGRLRISGMFSSTDPSSLIRFLREQPGVRLVESEREIHVSRG